MIKRRPEWEDLAREGDTWTASLPLFRPSSLPVHLNRAIENAFLACSRGGTGVELHAKFLLLEFQDGSWAPHLLMNPREEGLWPCKGETMSSDYEAIQTRIKWNVYCCPSWAMYLRLWKGYNHVQYIMPLMGISRGKKTTVIISSMQRWTIVWGCVHFLKTPSDFTEATFWMLCSGAHWSWPIHVIFPDGHSHDKVDSEVPSFRGGHCFSEGDSSLWITLAYDLRLPPSFSNQPCPAISGHARLPRQRLQQMSHFWASKQLMNYL